MRQVLFKRDTCALRGAEELRRPDAKVAPIGRDALGQRAANLKAQILRGGKAEAIPHIGKDHEAIEQVIPVRTAPGDVKRQVDLGRGKGLNAHHAAP